MKNLLLLNTNDLNSEIENMFQTETKRLIIISPFVFISEKLIEILNNSSAVIYLLYQKLKKDDIKDFKHINHIKKKLPKIKFIEIENLHAKAYISTDYSIITSLNLIENSQKRNFEFGIRFNNNYYKEIYKKLINELKNVLKKNNYLEKIFDDGYRFIPLNEYISKHYHPLKIFNMKYLYRDILENNCRDRGSIDDDDKMYIKISEIIDKKYKSFFLKQNGKAYNGNVLKKQAHIIEEIYLYGINTIKI